MTTKTATSRTFLLSKRRHSVRWFAPLQPEHVSSIQRVHEVVAQANNHSLWISDEKPLTDTLLHALASRTGSWGTMVLLYQPALASIPVLSRHFHRVVFGSGKGLLPPAELAEVLAAPNKADLFIGGMVDADSKTLTLWRGDLATLTVPFTAFPPSGDGITPDFSAFAVSDCGHTIRLGAYPLRRCCMSMIPSIGAASPVSAAKKSAHLAPPCDACGSNVVSGERTLDRSPRRRLRA